MEKLVKLKLQSDMEDFIHKLRQLDIEVEVVDHQLKLQIPEGFDAGEIIQEVRNNKEELIAFIQKAKQNNNYQGLPLAEEKAYYVCSAAQKRLFLLTEFDQNSLAYNMPRAIKLSGQLDKEKLHQAFNRLLDRHEVLRTSIHFIEGKVVQKIASFLNFELEYAHATPNDVNERIAQFVRPFDLGKSPLLRAMLLEISPEEHFLVVDIHHIVTDGVSHGILINDFMALYKEEDLPALSFQYKDYSKFKI